MAIDITVETPLVLSKAARTVPRVGDKHIIPKLPPQSTMDVARMLLRSSATRKGTLTLRRYQSQFWRFDGRRYVAVTDEEMVGNVQLWLDRKGLKADPAEAKKIAESLNPLCRVPDSRQIPAWVDGEQFGPGWVSFRNGLYRINDPADIRFLRHTPRFFTPWSLPYAFDADARCPNWMQFLHDVLSGDAERIELLQQIFGLALTSDTSFQKIFLLTGPPRSGKGTILRVLTALVGRENVATPTLSSLASRFGLAPLLGMSLAILPDAHLGRHTDGVRVVEVLKSISGEDPQDIDRKYKDALPGVRLSVRFVISCNEIASLTDASGALAGRLCVVLLENSYLGREDLSLESRLMTELAGIANWAIRGLARLRAAGRFITPTVSTSVTDDFRLLSSPVTAFLEECADVDPGHSVSCDDAYKAWVGWCNARGHPRGTHEQLGSAIRAVNAKIVRRRPRKDGGRVYIYSGFHLSTEGAAYRETGSAILTHHPRPAGAHNC